MPTGGEGWRRLNPLGCYLFWVGSPSLIPGLTSSLDFRWALLFPLHMDQGLNSPSFLEILKGLLHPWWLSGKESACNTADMEVRVRSLGQEDPLQEEMATYSSILAWEIPRTEEPDGLQSMGSQEPDTTWQLNNNRWYGLQTLRWKL